MFTTEVKHYGEHAVFMASIFAEAAHAAVGQKRKYTEDDYIVHPRAVALTVLGTAGVTTPMVMAALLHDVVEDTAVTLGQIQKRFGSEVALCVYHLTDQFTPDAYPEVNRKVRKQNEALRYATVPHAVKTIKLADMLDNTESIAQHDPGFLKTYGPEKRALLTSLVGGDAGLWQRCDERLIALGY